MLPRRSRNGQFHQLHTRRLVPNGEASCKPQTLRTFFLQRSLKQSPLLTFYARCEKLPEHLQQPHTPPRLRTVHASNVTSPIPSRP